MFIVCTFLPKQIPCLCKLSWRINQFLILILMYWTGRVWRSLRESAAAHTASYGRHRPLRRVQLFTGEEKESNVVQVSRLEHFMIKMYWREA